MEYVGLGAAAGGLVAALCFAGPLRGPGPTRGAAVPADPVDSAGVFAAGNTAVVTGAGSGIGRATAIHCASLGMNVVLADIHKGDLVRCKSACQQAHPKGGDAIVCQPTDVSNFAEVVALKDFAYRKFNRIDFLMNNAAIQNNGDASAIAHMDRWQETLAVNLMGVVHGCQAFGQAMVSQGTKAVIVNTGSKQGITMPPGDTAYNVSKSGVKTLTEGLQHTLRETPGCKVNAFLLVPGWTITMIATKGNQRLQGEHWDPNKAQDERSYDGVHDPNVAQEKLVARGAWPADNVVDRMVAAVNNGGPFYIICPDNETTEAGALTCSAVYRMDTGRMQWAADDLIFSRVPLSRWSKQYKDEYKAVSAGFV